MKTKEDIRNKDEQVHSGHCNKNIKEGVSKQEPFLTVPKTKICMIAV